MDGIDGCQTSGTHPQSQLVVGCDTLVALPNSTKDGQVLFAKNSDRPQEECQPMVQVEHLSHSDGSKVQCQYLEVPQVRTTYRHVGSRPFWCWGYEHGFNEHQVAIGNEGLWSRLPEFQEPKLLGMEILRLALERSSTASEAVEVMTALIAKYGQGCFKNDDGIFTCDNGYIVADPIEAYVIETAGHEWVVKEVDSALGISNIHSIQADWCELSPTAEDNALKEGWWNPGSGKLDFKVAYGDDPYPSRMPVDPAGSHRRERSCRILDRRKGEIDIGTMFGILRSHENGDMAESLFRAERHSFMSTCVHSSELDDPSFAFVTAASLVADLCNDGTRLPVYWCSFYSPCLGVFQPVFLEGQLPDQLSRGGSEADSGGLWWLFRKLESLVRQDDSGDAGEAVRAAWHELESEFRTTAYGIAEEAKRTHESGQPDEAARMLTEYMDQNLGKVMSALTDLLPGASL